MCVLFCICETLHVRRRRRRRTAGVESTKLMMLTNDEDSHTLLKTISLTDILFFLCTKPPILILQYDRVSTFLDSLWRSFESGRAQNYVIVAHGVSIRVFLARYFRYSIDRELLRLLVAYECMIREVALIGPL